MAEDHPVNQKIACAHLQKAGYNVVVVENGEEAVDICLEHGFDMILMDVQMLHMDGYEATRRIRAQESSCSDIPIVGLTAHAADALLIVVDPTNSSTETAQRIARLAADIDLRRVALVANRIVDPTDLQFITERLPELELVGQLPFSQDVLVAERERRSLMDLDGPVVVAVAEMLDGSVQVHE